MVEKRAMFSGLFRLSRKPVPWSDIEWGADTNIGHLEYLLWMIGQFASHHGEFFEFSPTGLEELFCRFGPAAYPLAAIVEMAQKGSTLDVAKTTTRSWLNTRLSAPPAWWALPAPLDLSESSRRRVFPDDLRDRLSGSGPTRWATDLTLVHVDYLVWVLGQLHEWGARVGGMLELMEPASRTDARPAAVAHQAVYKCVRTGARLHAGKGEPWEVGILLGRKEPEDWPAEIRKAIDAAAPDVRWRWVTTGFRGVHVLEGSGRDRRAIEAQVTPEGRVRVRTFLPWSEVPEAIAAAVRDSEGGRTFDGLWTSGPDLQTVRHYELTFGPRHYRLERDDVVIDTVSTHRDVYWWLET